MTSAQAPDPRSNPAAFASRLAARLCAVELPSRTSTDVEANGDLNHLHASFDARSIDWGDTTPGDSAVRRRLRRSAARLTFPLQQYLTSNQAASARLHDSHVRMIQGLHERIAELEHRIAQGPRESDERRLSLPKATPTDAAAAVDRIAVALEGHGHVVDVRCGSGSLLKALKVRGIPSSGIDSRWTKVGSARDEGLEAITADWRRVLLTMPAGTVGAIVATQALEWGSISDAAILTSGAFRALRPGGVLVVEVIDPDVLTAARGLLLPDLLCTSPIALTVLAKHTGFAVDHIAPPNGSDLSTLRMRDDDHITCPVHLIIGRRPTNA